MLETMKIAKDVDIDDIIQVEMHPDDEAYVVWKKTWHPNTKLVELDCTAVSDAASKPALKLTTPYSHTYLVVGGQMRVGI